MQPTSNAPAGSPGANATPAKPKPDAPLSSSEPTSGPAGSSYASYNQKSDDGIQAILASGKQAVDSSKKWLEDSDLAGKAKELPQKARNLGGQVLNSFNALTTAQKAVGVGVLAAGVAFLLTRGSRKSKPGSEYDRRSKAAKDEYFGHQPHTRRGNAPGPRDQRPWGTSRYGAPAPGGKPKAQSGSSHGPQGPRGGPRRDQGPAGGSRYDTRTAGRQNPNNPDGLGSAF